MNVEFLWQIGGGLIFAGSIYGAIRGDLKMIHEKIKKHDDAIDKLHARVDAHLTWHAENK